MLGFSSRWAGGVAFAVIQVVRLASTLSTVILSSSLPSYGIEHHIVLDPVEYRRVLFIKYLGVPCTMPARAPGPPAVYLACPAI